MEMEEEDEKNKETYVVGALGNVHATSFYREEDRSQVQGKLTREALKGDFLTLPILAPKGE